MSVEDLKQHSKKNNNKEKTYGAINLPYDCTSSLPEEPARWLEKYGITEREILVNHIQWSALHERLYFPIFDIYGNLCLLQGRYFGASNEAPRYSTRGLANTVLHWIGIPADTVVVVEDVLSAIKVGRICCAMPLFGSTISVERIIALSSRFKQLVVWLDRDKAKYALKARLRASSYFDEVRTIITEKDPKCYSDQEIKRFLKDLAS
jgi:DNA primase